MSSPRRNDRPCCVLPLGVAVNCRRCIAPVVKYTLAYQDESRARMFSNSRSSQQDKLETGRLAQNRTNLVSAGGVMHRQITAICQPGRRGLVMALQRVHLHCYSSPSSQCLPHQSQASTLGQAVPPHRTADLCATPIMRFSISPLPLLPCITSLASLASLVVAATAPSSDAYINTAISRTVELGGATSTLTTQLNVKSLSDSPGEYHLALGQREGEEGAFWEVSVGGKKVSDLEVVLVDG